MLLKHKPSIYQGAKSNTIFDSMGLRHNYYNLGGESSIGVYYLKVDPTNGNVNLETMPLVLNSIRSAHERDEKTKTIFLREYQLKDKTQKSKDKPMKVYKDAEINSYCFISLCGRICQLADYKKTKNTMDVSFFKGKYESNTIRFDEIPTAHFFKTEQGMDGYNPNTFEPMIRYLNHNKYHRESVYAEDVNEDTLRGTPNPLIKGRMYRNRFFYDTEGNSSFHNPNSRYVFMNHAMTKDKFFCEDGWLCDRWQYEIVDPKEIERFKKILLFLM